MAVCRSPDLDSLFRDVTEDAGLDNLFGSDRGLQSPINSSSGDLTQGTSSTNNSGTDDTDTPIGTDDTPIGTSGRTTPILASELRSTDEYSDCDLVIYPHMGIEWVRCGFYLTPKWTNKPTIASIVRTLRQEISPLKTYKVEHMHDGKYNKFYSVGFDGKSYVMKLSLPVCPEAKTASEVATLQWTKDNTKLPVPRVECYNSSRVNPTGCEWILMTKIEGKPLSKCWWELGSNIQCLIRTLAQYAADSFNKQFEAIGNLYTPHPEDPGRSTRFGPVVSMQFFWHKRSEITDDDLDLQPKPFKLSNGPFNTRKEWVRQRLNRARKETNDRIKKNLDKETRNRMFKIIDVINQVGDLHDVLFPDPDDPEPTMLWHDNLTMDNIFVNENGFLTGVLEWECVSCIPLPEACQWPAFLQEGHCCTTHPVEWPLNDPDAERARKLFWHMMDKCKNYEKWSDGVWNAQPTNAEEEDKKNKLIAKAQKKAEVAKNKAASAAAKAKDDKRKDLAKAYRKAVKAAKAGQVKPKQQSKCQSNGQSSSDSESEEEEENAQQDQDDESMADEDVNGQVEDPDAMEGDELQDEEVQDGESVTSVEDPWEENVKVIRHDNAPNFSESQSHDATQKGEAIQNGDAADNVDATQTVDEDQVVERDKEVDVAEQDVTGNDDSSELDDEEADEPAIPDLRLQYRTRKEYLERVKREYPDWVKVFLQARNTYLRELRDYELSRLRQNFTREMKWRCPGWMDVLLRGRMRRDYEAAVQNCADEDSVDLVKAWVGAVHIVLARGMDPTNLENYDEHVESLAYKLTQRYTSGLDGPFLPKK